MHLGRLAALVVGGVAFAIATAAAGEAQSQSSPDTTVVTSGAACVFISVTARPLRGKDLDTAWVQLTPNLRATRVVKRPGHWAVEARWYRPRGPMRGIYRWAEMDQMYGRKAIDDSTLVDIVFYRFPVRAATSAADSTLRRLARSVVPQSIPSRDLQAMLAE